MTATESVIACLARRVGDQPMDETSELAALGVDSLLLLRVITDLAVDETQEIDPQALAGIATVGDLADFVSRWNTGVAQ
ncbi:acyl carrier protein [Streptomyces xiaopingdaonensis]|uniref:acyl carrier protein n=1 Tax=Streptomyces xiaopingdaonensis TaxID=1565415 RepID=UPI0003756437|nr:acyl carrier protein [Streptomyces xiaopingdaonensis]